MTTPRRRGPRIQQEQQVEQGVAVPLYWADVEAKEFVFANQIFARYTSGAYWLTFGQAHGPFHLDTDEARLKKEGVVVRPVVKIAVTPEVLANMLELLTGLYNRIQNQPGRSGQ